MVAAGIGLRPSQEWQALVSACFWNFEVERTIRRRRNSPWYMLDADKAFWLFALFAAFVFLTGGGSRYDVESAGPLRAVSAIVLAIALYFQTAKSVRRVAVPVLVIGALAIWMIVQLIPLPPSLWTALPGRGAIAELGGLAGLGDVWRPITFSPMKTANSLASLIVPLAGLSLLALLDDRGWRRLPWVFIAAGAASALFGIAQILLRDAGGLYLYDITNEGSAVGLFSNRNHNAIFLTVALLFCVIRLEAIKRKAFGPADLVAIIAALTIFAGLLVNASRSGLLGLGIVGLVFAVRALLYWRRRKSMNKPGGIRLAIGAGVGLISLAVIGLFAAMGRSPAIERLLERDVAEDQRLETLPTVLSMVRDFQPFGAGFGAFEQAFRTVETNALLTPRYLNNAHNDWLQFPIEGGIPAILIGLIVIALLILRTLRIARIDHAHREMAGAAWLGILAIGVLALASIVDYPLRTPSLMLLAAAAATMMFKPLAVSKAG